MFAFTDINYTELRDEEKMRRLVDYSALLNSIDKGIYAKIGIFFSTDTAGAVRARCVDPDEPGR